MQINAIVRRINNKLAGEQLTYGELIDFLDDIIDLINSDLNTVYPAFSELPTGSVEYTAFPDKWIRQVLVPGAAWKFYVSDEEGMATAEQYRQDFYDGLFKMLRDTLYDIPAEYQADVEQGSIIAPATNTVLGDRGFEWGIPVDEPAPEPEEDSEED